MIAFEVYGTPKPQGSMKAFLPKNSTRPIVTTDNKGLKPWRALIADEARLLNPLKMHGPVEIHLDFFFNPPKSDPYRKYHTVKPDVDKLTRAVLDALKGVVIVDDSQVVRVNSSKRYSPQPEHVFILVEPVKEGAFV